MISVADNILRIQPPLNIDENLFKKAFTIIDEAMQEYKQGSIPDKVLDFKQGW